MPASPPPVGAEVRKESFHALSRTLCMKPDIIRFASGALKYLAPLAGSGRIASAIR
jgi:hypothetical protein